MFGYDDMPNFPPRYNIAPTQPIAIVRMENGRRRFALARWGLIPPWVKDPAGFSLLINARAETAAEKPAFRGSMRQHRCLIPASGFYEWRKTGDATKQPFWIAPKDATLIAFAGLSSDWGGADGSQVETAAILTTSANESLKHVHHRMPAVIFKKDFERWLDVLDNEPRHVRDLLAPPPDDLFEAVPVSTRVNAVRNDDPGIQEPCGIPAVPPVRRKTAGRAKTGDEKQYDLF